MTDKSILEWIDSRNCAQAAERHKEKLYLEAENAIMPTALQVATAKDIQVGTIIWYRPKGYNCFWRYVEEVLEPSDMYKAFYATDGNRYGLKDAYIEIVSLNKL